MTQFHKSLIYSATVFALTMAALPANAQSPDSANEQLDFAKILNLPKALVETHISVTWSDGSPVVGAKVFDHRKHILLGVTDSFGKLMVTVANGALLRVVDPNYGQQQALQIVQGKKKNDKEMMSTTSTSPYSSTLAIGWTIS